MCEAYDLEPSTQPFDWYDIPAMLDEAYPVDGGSEVVYPRPRELKLYANASFIAQMIAKHQMWIDEISDDEGRSTWFPVPGPNIRHRPSNWSSFQRDMDRKDGAGSSNQVSVRRGHAISISHGTGDCPGRIRNPRATHYRSAPSGYRHVNRPSGGETFHPRPLQTN